MSSMCASAQLSPAAGARRSVSLRAAQRSAFAPAPARCLRAATAPAGRSRGASLVVRAEEAATQGSDPKTLTVSLPSVLDINEIMNRLPHRFPFLLVDRIIEYVPGKYAIGIKNVTINDNFFPGHFPTRPLMPGVLQVEAMAQVGGLVMLTPEVGGSKENFFFGGVDACRFRRPVLPGDVLVMKVELIKLNKRFGMAKMKAEAYVGDKLACEAELTMILG